MKDDNQALFVADFTSKKAGPNQLWPLSPTTIPADALLLLRCELGNFFSLLSKKCLRNTFSLVQERAARQGQLSTLVTQQRHRLGAALHTNCHQNCPSPPLVSGPEWGHCLRAQRLSSPSPCTRDPGASQEQQNPSRNPLASKGRSLNGSQGFFGK